MNELRRKALASLPLSEATVQSFYDGSRSGTAEQCLKALCVSHERLRAALQGAESLIAEEPGKAAVRSLLTAAKEAVAVLRSPNGHERLCRELIAAKSGLDDLATVLTNVMRHLDDAAERVEGGLSPMPIPAGDFEAWLQETFNGRDTDLKIEAVPHAYVLSYEQAIALATFVWQCMENKPPPWWSKFAELPEAARRLVNACRTCGYDCDQVAVMDGMKAVEAAMAKQTEAGK